MCTGAKAVQAAGVVSRVVVFAVIGGAAGCVLPAFDKASALKCDGTMRDCDGDPRNLCETDIATSLSHCGACGAVCGDENAVAVCLRGSCKQRCDADFADCDGDPSNGCEADLASDGDNCSACGKTCKGGGCNDGKCGPRPTELISGQAAAFGLVVDATHVYWTTRSDDGSVLRAPLDNPTVLILAHGQSKPRDIAVDDASAYWVNEGDGTVMRVALDGGDPVVLAAGQDTPWAIALDETHVYWTSAGAGTVMKVGKTGGEPTAIATAQQGPHGIAADAAAIYFTSNGLGAVRRVGLSGGRVSTLASKRDLPERIAVDDRFAFWTEAGGSVARVALGGRSLSTLATDAAGASGIALDQNDVYFTRPEAGVVARVPKTGGKVVGLAESGVPQRVAVGSTSVYWSDSSSGAIMKLDK